MKSKDLIQEEKTKFWQRFKEGLESKDEKVMQEAFSGYADYVQSSLLQTAQEISCNADSVILASRGIRQLTNAEQEYYSGLVECFKAVDVQQALTNFDKSIPQTVIDTVMEDIKKNHELFNYIDLKNTNGAVRWLYNTGKSKMAVWGKITTAITEELSGSINTVDLLVNKLTAFIPVPKDLLDLGAGYIDAYVREILVEASASGFEHGILKGDGNGKPIGAVKNLNGAVVSGAYPDKTKVKVTSFEVGEYSKLVSQLAEKENGDYRAISEVLLIVNPFDYYNLIVPATTVLATDGSYKGNIFPIPTKVIQSTVLSKGEAVMGIDKAYMLCVTSGTSGKIEYSDQYQFLEDNRVYTTKLYAEGRPKDNNAFLYLDISKVKPAEIKVQLINSADTTSEKTTS